MATARPAGKPFLMTVKEITKKLLPLIDIVAVPFVLISAVFLRYVRKADFQRMKRSKAVLLHVGLLPVVDHYYEPFFDPRRLRKPLREDRNLPGIDFSVSGQLALLKQFTFNEEIKRLPMDRLGEDLGFHHSNTTFGCGDAEYLYNVVRHFKPKRIVEIGSGFSTLISLSAIRANQAESPKYSCELTCIEPYEMPWLERTSANILRKRVENIEIEFFQRLEANDILFIDSSHVIKPQGDVLFEYHEILPSLKPGVLVHVHDIFTPKDYPDSWLKGEMRLWNEQYLLEAFLAHNQTFRIVGALNYLMHHHFEVLASVCPILASEPNREPGSLWLTRLNQGEHKDC
jgi:predicted O-methyltransferase YrrM